MKQGVVMKIQFLSGVLALTYILSSSPSLQAQQNAEAPAVGKITTEQELKIERRIKARRLNSLGFGPMYSNKNQGDSKMMYGFTYYKHWEVSEHGEIRAGLLVGSSMSATAAHIGIGGNYLFSTGDASPLIGAELGLGSTSYALTPGDNFDRGSSGGFTAQVFTGMRFFRTSDAQMELLASYTTVLNGDSPGFAGAMVKVLF